jgi:hypothetical protein
MGRLDTQSYHPLNACQALLGRIRSVNHLQSAIIIHSFTMSTDTINEYDLSGVVSGFLDKHLVFPLLEFLSQKKLYDAKDIETSKLELVEKTNMVDYAVDIHQQLYQTEEVRAIGRDNDGRGDGGPDLIGPVDGRLSSFCIHTIHNCSSLIFVDTSSDVGPRILEKEEGGGSVQTRRAEGASSAYCGIS